MSWAQIMKGALCGTLDLDDAYDREMPLYRKFTDTQKEKIEKMIKRLIDWNGWQIQSISSELDRKLSDNVKEITNFFREKGLTTGYLMGAQI